MLIRMRDLLSRGLLKTPEGSGNFPALKNLNPKKLLSICAEDFFTVLFRNDRFHKSAIDLHWSQRPVAPIKNAVESSYQIESISKIRNNHTGHHRGHGSLFEQLIKRVF